MTSRQQKASSILLYRTRSPPQTADYSPYQILYCMSQAEKVEKVEKETFFIEREEEIEKKVWGGEKKYLN